MTRGTGIVGYNVQTAVDAKHHLIVAHEVTNIGSDRDQLSSMAKQVREAMGRVTLSVVADKGYFKLCDPPPANGEILPQARERSYFFNRIDPLRSVSNFPLAPGSDWLQTFVFAESGHSPRK